jgi:hypothetical protein
MRLARIWPVGHLATALFGLTVAAVLTVRLDLDCMQRLAETICADLQR